MLLVEKKKVVIVGAGNGGLTLARNLLQRESTKLDITLVDRSYFQHNYQELSLAAAGFTHIDNIKIPFPLLIDDKIRFVNSSLKEVQPERKRLLLDSSTLDYDFLVIALGSVTNYYEIKGASENATKLKNADDAAIINKKLEELKNESSITIVGGGATGVSLAGAIADFALKQGKTSQLHISLLESQSNILKKYNPLLSSRIYDILTKKGVNIITNSVVSEVTSDSVILKDGTKIPSSLSLWTAGVKGAQLPSGLKFKTTGDGRIIVNEYCQCLNYSDIFAIGDIAALKNEDDFYPMLGQVAFKEAVYLADQLVELISKGKFMPTKFNHKIEFMYIPLGVKDYAAHIGDDLVLSGSKDEFKGQLLKLRKKHTIVNNVLNDMEQEEISSLINKVNILKYKCFKELRNMTNS